MGADGSRIDLLDESTMRLRWTYADGTTADADARLLREEGLEMGEGVAGRAAAEGRAVWTGDYLADPAVRPGPASARFVEETGVRSVLSTPLPGIGRPLGALSVVATRVDAFDRADADLLDAFAVQASIALTNSRRLQALARATEENARRAVREKSLREIAARIGELRDPGEIVQLTVDEAARLLSADGARVDIAGDEGAALRRQLGEIVSDDEFRLGFDDADWDGSPGVSGDGGPPGARLRHGRLPGGPLLRPAARAGRRDPASRHPIRAGRTDPRRRGADRRPDRPRRGRRTPSTSTPAATLEALAGLAAAALRNAILLGRVSASEARMQDLVATSPDLIWEADAEGRLTVVSGLAEKILGMPGSELAGRHFTEAIHPGSLDVAVAEWQRLVANPDEILTVRFSLLHADGSEVPIENVAVALVEDGRFAGARGAARDIRERARLEAELRESEERYRYLVQSSPDAIWRTDAAGQFTFLSATIEPLTGYTPDELVGESWERIVEASSLEQARVDWGRLAAATGESVRERLLLLRRDGSTVPTEVSAVGIIENGRFTGAHGAIRDISERERLERELRESDARLRDLMATSPDLIWEADAEGNLTYIEGLAREMLGIPANELVGRHFSETVYPDEASAAASWELWEASRREPGRIHTARFSLRHADGSPIPIENVAVPLVVDGVFVGSRGAARDIRERERLERELRESEERYRDLVQTSPDGVWQADAEGTFTFWSDTAAALTGFPPEAILGRHWSTVVGARALEDAFGAWQQMAEGGGTSVRVRLDLVRRSGEDLPAEVAAVPVIRDGRFAGAHGSVRDLREQLRLERELRDSEARFRELVQTSPDGVWQTEPGGHLVFWSDAARALLGWEPEELLSRHWSTVIAPNAVEEVRARLKPLADGPPDAVARVRTTVRPPGRHGDPRGDLRAFPCSATGASAASRGPSATSASRSGWSASCASRRAPWPRRRSGRTLPASSTTR